MDEIATCYKCKKQKWNVYTDRVVCIGCGNVYHFSDMITMLLKYMNK